MLVTNTEYISRANVNTSKSKQLYSFPTTQRFSDRKQINAKHAYELKSAFKTFDSRKSSRTSFGASKRPDHFGNKGQKPAPTAYTLSSFVD
jgi:hypothetical protein